MNGFECVCPPGYYDYRCASVIVECNSSPCVNGGTCIDAINRSALESDDNKKVKSTIIPHVHDEC